MLLIVYLNEKWDRKRLKQKESHIIWEFKSTKTQKGNT